MAVDDDQQYWHVRPENLAAAIGIEGRRAAWTYATQPEEMKLTPSMAHMVARLSRWAESAARNPWQTAIPTIHLDSDILGVVLYGPPGTGKTGLAIATARRRAAWLLRQESLGDDLRALAHPKVLAAVAEGRSTRKRAGVWYEDWQAMALRIGGGEFYDRYKQMEELSACDTVVIDDCDSGSMTEYRESVLRVLVERPERNKRVLLVVNASPREWKDRLGERIADRLAERALFATCAVIGPSARK